MCTDIPPSAAHSTSSHAMLCRTILPRDWSALDAATLCEGRGTPTTPTTTPTNNSSSGGRSGSGSGSGSSSVVPSSRRQTEAAVRCAVETSSFSASSSTAQKLRLSHPQVTVNPSSFDEPLMSSLTAILKRAFPLPSKWPITSTLMQLSLAGCQSMCQRG